MSEELRRFPRIASRHSVLVKKVGERGDHLVEEFGSTKTIALGGCSFTALEKLGTNSDVELLIAVEGRVINASGRVVYERDLPDGRFEIGVEWARLEPADASRIAELFEQSTAASEG